MSKTEIKNKYWIKYAGAQAAISIAVFVFFAGSASAAPDSTIYYQGKLTVNPSDVAVADNPYNFKFRIYNASSGGTCLWSARGDCDTPEAKSVAVSKGIFSTALGEAGDEPLNLNFNSNYWLEVTVGNDSPMNVRKKINAAGYALNSTRLDGGTWEEPGAIGATTPNSAAFTTLDSSEAINLATGDGSTVTIGNSTGAATLASGGASSWANTAGDLTISTDTSGTLALTSASALNLSGTSLVVDTSATSDTINIEQGTYDSILSFTQPGAATQTYTFATGGTVATSANNLSIFAATTSAQLSGILTDENTSGGYMTDVMTTAGDLIYAGASGVPARLGEGTNDAYVLKINTTTHMPYWSADLQGSSHTQNTDTGTDGTSFTIGDGTTTFAINTGATNDTLSIEQGTYDSLLTFTQNGSDQQEYIFTTGGTVCTTGGVCAGYQPSGSYLTAEADTLATVTSRGSITNGQTITIGPAATYDPIILSAIARGATSYAGTITSADLTSTNRTWTFPDLDGTVALAAQLHNAVTVSDTATVGLSLATQLLSADIVANSIGDTQLAYDTGQTLTSGSTPTFEDTALTGLSGSIISSTSVETSIEELDEAVYKMGDTGFDAWTSGADANTYTITGGKFQLDRSGAGFIKGKKVTWSSGQQTGVLAANDTYWIYIDATGLIQSSTTYPSNNIIVFEVLYDGTNYDVVKENHSYAFDSGASGYLHNNAGTVIRGNGAIITRVATGTGGANGDREIKIVGADYVDDHGLSASVPDSAGAGVSWQTYYVNGSGDWINYASQAQMPMYYNSSGTATTLTSGGGTDYNVYTLYVSKNDIESSNPTYIAVMGNGYASASAAQTAINDGTVNFASNELDRLEMAQLGYAIVQNNGSNGYVYSLTVAKSTFNRQLVGGSSGADHGTLTGLSDDDHTQYVLLAGRTSGQTLIGGTGTTDDLILRTTAGAGASGADMIFQTGDNGDVEAMRIGYTGNIGINLATAAQGNIDIRQRADGNDIIYSRRFTDTSPTGNFLHFLNAAGDTDIFSLSVAGDLSLDGGSVAHDASTGVTTIDNLQLGAMNFPTDGGTLSWVDMPIASATDNTVESYTAQLDGNPMLTIYGLADGSGGVDTLGVGILNSAPAYPLDVLGAIRTGGAGTDGALHIYSDQATDRTASLYANTNMSTDAIFYLPADEPVGTYLLNMTTGGVMGYDTNTYALASALHTQNTDTGTDGTNFTIGDGTTTFTIDTAAANDAINIEQGTYDSQLVFTQNLSAAQTYTFTTGGVVTTLGNTVTGNGSVVLASSPVLTTPSLGVATATSINGNAITAGTGTLTLSTYTLTVANTASISGTNTGDQFTSTSASVLIGRGSVGGVGAAQEITLGTNLSMSGTTLNATGGGGMTNPMTTAGDIIYGGASGAPTRLAGSGTDDWVLKYDTATSAPYWGAGGGGVTDHGALTGLTDDDHSIYALLSGRGSGGQTFIGGTGTTDDLILRTTAGAGASGADMIFQTGDNGNVEAMRIFYDGHIGIGTATDNGVKLEITGTTEQLRLGYDTDSYAKFTTANDSKLTLETAESTQSMIKIGKGSAQDAGVSFDGNTYDYYVGMDDTTDELLIGLGLEVGTAVYMTIEANGEVGIGTSDPAYDLDVGGGSAGYDIRGYDVYTHDGGATSFSDSRLKDIRGDYQKGLAEIMGINTIVYQYKSDNPLGLDSQYQNIGLIAQELQSIIPEAVSVGNDGFLTVTTAPIFYAMINAIQEENRKLDGQIALSKALEGKIKTVNEKTLTAEEALEQLEDEGLSIENRLSASEQAISDQGARIAELENLVFAQNQMEDLEFMDENYSGLEEAALDLQSWENGGLEFIKADLVQAEENIRANEKMIEGLDQDLDQVRGDLLTVQSVLAGTVDSETAEADALAWPAENIEGLVIGSPVEFQGKTLFRKLADFADSVIFREKVSFAGEVEFDGPVTFHNDSAGYAVVARGKEEVEIQFEKGYAQAPVVNASLSLQQIEDPEFRSAIEDLVLSSDVKFVITNVTPESFRIKLSQVYDWEIPFSWSATGVRDAKIFGQGDPAAGTDPEQISEQAEDVPISEQDMENTESVTGEGDGGEAETVFSEEIPAPMPEQISIADDNQ